MIVAADERDTIGRGGTLPWHLPEDLKRFRRLTTGHVVIAGRLTQDSIVERLGHALPDRTTIVMTRREGRTDSGSTRYVCDVDDALALARQLETAGEIFVIGGAQLYQLTLPAVERVYLTRVHGEFDGDRAMPAGWLDGFRPVEEEPGETFTFITYDRA